MDDDVAAHVRQYLTEDDVKESEVERTCRLHVLAFAQRQHLGSHRPEEPGPLEAREDDGEGEEARWPKDRGHHDEDDEVGDGEEHVGDADDDRVDATADARRHRTERHRDDRGEGRGEECHGEDVAAPPDDLIEDVTSAEVGPQRVRRRGCEVHRRDVRGLLEWHEDRTDEREEHEEDDPDESDEADRAPREGAKESGERGERSRERAHMTNAERRAAHPAAPPARPMRGSSRLYNRSAMRFARTTATVVISRIPCITG